VTNPPPPQQPIPASATLALAYCLRNDDPRPSYSIGACVSKGNCLFIALARSLSKLGAPIDHVQLRKKVADFCSDNVVWCIDNKLFKHDAAAKYTTTMREDGVAGDHVALYATAVMFQYVLLLFDTCYPSTNESPLTVIFSYRCDIHILDYNGFKIPPFLGTILHCPRKVVRQDYQGRIVLWYHCGLDFESFDPNKYRIPDHYDMLVLNPARSPSLSDLTGFTVVLSWRIIYPC
jgi:hypothetical protein